MSTDNAKHTWVVTTSLNADRLRTSLRCGRCMIEVATAIPVNNGGGDTSVVATANQLLWLVGKANSITCYGGATDPKEK